MVCGLFLLLPPTLSVHLLQRNVLFLIPMLLAVAFPLTVVSSLKAVGIQKQLLAVKLLSRAGEHHVQAQLAEGLQVPVGWVAGGAASGARGCPQGCACRGLPLVPLGLQ